MIWTFWTQNLSYLAVKTKMELKIVDLYEFFGQKKAEDLAGILSCYIQKTDAAVVAKRLRPAILVLPGGGYGHVSHREAEPVALRLLAAGFSVFCLRYTVAPSRNVFPAALREAAMAMRYIRENAEEMEVDSAGVAAIGFSAGGHLCGMLGTMYDCAEVADIGSAGLLRPDALGLCYPVAVSWGNTHVGSFDNLCGADTALRQRLSLENRVRPDMPPVFLWHTRNDETVPCRNSLILAAALEQAGVDFVLHMYRNGHHGLSTADAQAYPAYAVPETSWDVPGWLDAMCRFFRELGFSEKDEG